MDFMLPYKIIFVSTFLAVSMTTGCSGTEGQMKQMKALQDNPSSPDISAPEHNLTKEVSILQTWSGDYPVAQLERLPDGQRHSSIGVIGDDVSFAAVWETFKPGENMPEVDFSKNIVVFTRNVNFYNRTNIFRVTLKNGMAEVLAMETMSALPIEDRAAMAIAVIPRTGVRFIRVGEGQVVVR